MLEINVVPQDCGIPSIYININFQELLNQKDLRNTSGHNYNYSS